MIRCDSAEVDLTMFPDAASARPLLRYAIPLGSTRHPPSHGNRHPLPPGSYSGSVNPGGLYSKLSAAIGCPQAPPVTANAPSNAAAPTIRPSCIRFLSMWHS